MAVSTAFKTAIALTVSTLVGRLAPTFLIQTSIWKTAIVIFSVLILMNLTWTVILWPKFFSPLRKLPGPKDGNYFMGHFKEILKRETGAPAREWINDIDNDGILKYNHALNAERVLLTNPEALREVLVTKSYDFIKPPEIQKSIGRILGIGVLFAEGDEHKRQRRHLMPAFAFRHIKDLYSIFWAKAGEVTDAMTHELKQSPIYGENTSGTLEIGQWASRATLDIIGSAGMGHDFRSVQDPNNELTQTYKSIFNPGKIARYLQLLQIFIPFWIVRSLPVKRNDDLRNASTLIRNVCLRLIHEKRSRLKHGSQSDHDILSVAIESGGFSDEDLVNQLMTFLAAGHETTASTMTWAALLLCQNPGVQNRLRDEIRAHLPSVTDSSRPVTSADIDSLPYLNAVCNEVLRFYPPVPSTLRVAAKDSTIVGWPIPKGTYVILAPWAVNFRPKHWGPDAAVFNPDRWIDPTTGHTNNTGGADSNFSFLTFLHGPRSCIGQAFAKAEFACLLAGWVGRFEMELENPDQEIEIKGGITARPKGGLNVRMKVLDGW